MCLRQVCDISHLFRGFHATVFQSFLLEYHELRIVQQTLFEAGILRQLDCTAEAGIGTLSPQNQRVFHIFCRNAG